jgi:hypothetical protein
VGWLPFDVSPALARLKPDIVQFHWAGRGAAVIESMRRLSGYRIVWTLRDMWPLTGGCHYSEGCEKFLTECRECPQLRSSFPVDLARWQCSEKYRSRIGIPITFVALSNCWPTTRGAALWFSTRSRSFPMGWFSPLCADGQSPARALWGLPATSGSCVRGRQGDFRSSKGLAYLQDALNGWPRMGAHR